jgi:hypothetical protein
MLSFQSRFDRREVGRELRQAAGVSHDQDREIVCSEMMLNRRRI